MEKQQAGIYSIALYENKDLSVLYDSNGDISSISNTGAVLEFDTDNNTIQLQNTLSSARNNEILNNYEIKLHLDNLENQGVTEQINDSIYGWVPLFTFMDNQTKIINTPFLQSIPEVNTQVSHTYNLVLKPRINTIVSLEDVIIINEPIFDTVIIGNQEWMNFNLNFNDGGSGIKSSNNDPLNDVGFGLLYNDVAANRIADSVTGYRIPNGADYFGLNSSLGPTNKGGKLKSTGFDYFNSPNAGATNEVGFNGRGAGMNTGVSVVDFMEDSYIRLTLGSIQLNYLTGDLGINSNPDSWYKSLRLIKE